jgi:23S rRNA (cytosine1962-C5)-methyltransferase
VAFSNPSVFSNSELKRLAVKLTAKGERSVKSGHPWVFSDSIEKINVEGKPGDLAIIFGRRSNSVVGVGLYDPSSAISIKMIHSGGPATIDANFFRSKIQSAYTLRTELFTTDTNSYRLLFGENDGFPGLIVDVYAHVAVIKLYSEIWLPYLQWILPEILQVTKADTAVIRLSRSLQETKRHSLVDGQVVIGTLPDELVEFKEHGLRFRANVVHGHKTGYFLDHRHNRKRVGELARGKSVLDVFCYAGGFSVHALAGGAKSVLSIDISEQALEVAKENASLNQYTGAHTTLAGDAFAELKSLTEKGKTFDIVIIDPPTFASSQQHISIALKKYAQLAALGAKLTATNGLLLLASCSARVVAPAFFQKVEEVLDASGRSYKVEARTEHDIDHLVTFPEGAYLKCGYYKFLD